MTSLYCQGKLCETGFSVHPCCDDVNKGGCCETKSSFLKVADGFVKSSCDTLVKVLSFERLNYSHELLAQIFPPESAVKPNVQDRGSPVACSGGCMYLYLCTLIL